MVTSAAFKFDWTHSGNGQIWASWSLLPIRQKIYEDIETKTAKKVILIFFNIPTGSEKKWKSELIRLARMPKEISQSEFGHLLPFFPGLFYLQPNLFLLLQRLLWCHDRKNSWPEVISWWWAKKHAGIWPWMKKMNLGMVLYQSYKKKFVSRQTILYYIRHLYPQFMPKSVIFSPHETDFESF